MKKKFKITGILVLSFLFCFMIAVTAACGFDHKEYSGAAPEELTTEAEGGEEASSLPEEIPVYYHTGMTFTPMADGEKTDHAEGIDLDYSNLDQGYIMLMNSGDIEKILVELVGEDRITYHYYISEKNNYVTLPLTAGNGKYSLIIYEHLVDDQYAMLYGTELDVTLENSVIPFLYPSQYVDFTGAECARALAQELTAGKNELDAVSSVYDYVISHISYDYEKAATVESGYLPDIDGTLKEEKGICFDYAALMTGMLRSVNIPTRLDIGYSKDIYHAWISIYSENQGWLNQVLMFDGQDWNLMDPTMESANGGTGTSYELVETDYNLEYVH